MSNEIKWDLFERTLAAIKANPEHWNQKTWHCGTSHCFAGFAHIIDLMDRGKISCPINEVKGDWSSDPTKLKWTLLGEDSDSFATIKLGLFFGQSSWLFFSERSIEDFEECLKRKTVPTRGCDDQTVWP